MEAGKLMVGNLVKKNGLVVTVTGRMIFDIWGFNQHKVKKTGYSPIPLTEKWANDNASTITRKGGKTSYYFVGEGDYMPCIQFDDNGVAYWIINMATSVSLPYVHTWQNLFLALTKENFKIK